MAPTSLQKATRILESYVAGGDEPGVWKLWIVLPDGLDEALLDRAFERALKTPHDARTVGRALNPAYLELFIAALGAHPRWPETLAASCVGGESPRRRSQQLGELFRKLGQLGIFSLSVSQLDERIRAFAGDALFAEAARRIVVAGAEWEESRDFARWALVGVLMEDASPASVDAMLPLVERACREGSRELDVLRRVLRRRRSPAPALEPLRRLLEQKAAGRPGRRELPAVAAAVGLEPVPATLAFSWTARVVGADGRWTVVSLAADLDAEPHFRLDASEPLPGQVPRGVRGPTSWRRSVVTSEGVQENDLGLPALPRLAEWRAWSDQVLKLRGARWEGPNLWRSTLRGRNRERLKRWLLGEPGEATRGAARRARTGRR